MKTRLLIFGLILIGFVSVTALSHSLLAADEPSRETLVKANNTFAFDLYNKLAVDPGNLFCSPYSISVALAMTSAGARGDTAAQMVRALHFDAVANPHAALADLTNAFNAKGKIYRLAIANALWGQTGYLFQADFLALMKRYYGAGFRQVDYVDDGRREQARRAINRWVADQTQQKIQNLIQPRILNALTRLVLTNAIYFKGKWAQQFKPADTRELPFYLSDREKITVPLMRQKEEFKYTEDAAAQFMELPYQGGDLSMALILPRPEVGLKKLEEQLTPAKLQKWLSQSDAREVEVFLPRFKLEQSIQLNEVLKGLGVVDAFDDSLADFSGMAPQKGLYITNVIHKAFVDVQEEGTEAAAATAVIMGAKAMPPQKKLIFRADRPFVFLIRDNRSGSILFMGRCMDPR